MTVTVSAFYKFVVIDDCESLRSALCEAAERASIKGTILIAREGINATIAGNDAGIADFMSKLRSNARFADLEDKRSYCDMQPFRRLKVKVKREIVTFGLPNADPTVAVGTYVDPHDWNALISDPDVVVVDTRNDYEYAIGTFARAENPHTKSFGELPRYIESRLSDDKTRKIAMFCTGGIRCEKATAYLLSEGFTSVYHLQGGILKYLEVIRPEESRWRGECFVFDERVALRHGVEKGSHILCPGCGFPVGRQSPGAAPALCSDCQKASDPSR